jgi:hypothetical protein
MAPPREEFQPLLQIEQVMKTGRAATRFVWSDGVKGIFAGPGFFEKYGWDSDERMHVNEVASYYETLALAWQRGFVDEELVLDWAPATLYWGLIGTILLAARDMLGDPELWSGFEALAAAQESSSGAASPADEDVTA